MNELEKRSFYSFLTLYVASSFFLITLVGYWYYISQKQSLQTHIHYKLEHLVDQEAGRIITSRMEGTPYRFVPPGDGVTMALLNAAGKVLYGDAIVGIDLAHPGFVSHHRESTLISDAAKGHLGVQWIVVRSRELAGEIDALQQKVSLLVLLVMLVVAVIAWILSGIFMRPLQRRVRQIEDFINDITHELNTPITALSMTARQALKEGLCTDRQLNNIDISTKQLYDMYRSLTYLNFDEPSMADEVSDVGDVLRTSIAYYRSLAEMKRIDFDVAVTDALHYPIPEQRLSLLFGNLIGNAIKYSSARSVIHIRLTDHTFTIEDHGIGIPHPDQLMIFRRYQRGTKQSGGFGIGLHIVKSICDQHGIGIRIDSVVGEGTTFILVFSDVEDEFDGNKDYAIVTH